MKTSVFIQNKENFLSKCKSRDLGFIKKAFKRKAEKSLHVSELSMFTIYRNKKGSLYCIGDAYKHKVDNVLFSGLTLEDC